MLFPAQLDLLHSFAEQNSIEIVKEFTEAETAKQAGRHEFNAMLKYLKQHKDIKTILVGNSKNTMHTEKTIYKTGRIRRTNRFCN